MGKGKGKGKGRKGGRGWNKRQRNDDEPNPTKRQKTGDYSDKMFCFPGCDPTSLRLEGSEEGGAFTLQPYAEGESPTIGTWTRADVDPEAGIPKGGPQPVERVALSTPQFPGLKVTFSRKAEELRLTSIELKMGEHTLTFPGMLKFETQKAAKAEDDGSESDDEHIPKRMVALMFGYVGSAYQGLQMNPDCNSVELHLEKALVNTGCIKQCNSMAENDNVLKIKWTRCGRTDKGVHAAAQVVGVKLRMVDDLINTVNKHLPDDIRLLGCTRVTKSFNAKLHCTGRSYVYMLPATALGGAVDVAKMNRILSCFKGTHNFHNYTNLRKAAIASAESQANNRYMTNLQCGDVRVIDGVSFVPLMLDGQSFLFNQIRHMVAMSVMAYRSGCDYAAVITQSFEPDQLYLPLTPGNFLYLDKCHYGDYKTKVAQQDYGDASSMDFSSVEADRQQFLDQGLFPHLAALETAADGVLQPWLDKCYKNTEQFEGLYALLQTNGGEVHQVLNLEN